MKPDITRLKESLAKGIVPFSYIKSDGTVRSAKGTTNHSIISKTWTSKGCPSTTEPAGYINYFDMEKGWWRCFAESRLVSMG